jgi:hypothetical protein
LRALIGWALRERVGGWGAPCMGLLTF